ncbi:MAG: TetR/AcrR family transcriptional regulator [Propionibacteriaceae bacterium]|jgi:AcrR family transcriptional regulator|nr:TetR/AcrR family transcriptional regulator [Propionibacteriaceae bacterium]
MTLSDGTGRLVAPVPSGFDEMMDETNDDTLADEAPAPREIGATSEFVDPAEARETVETSGARETTDEETPRRRRMTSAERRDQLITVARSCFSEKGFDGTSVEEIAARAAVSKPVLYEHFGGKEGLYAVVVDREVQTLLTSIRHAITAPGSGSRVKIERGTLALLDYIESCPEGFQIIMRDSSETGGGGFTSILNDVIVRVEDILTPLFSARGIDPDAVPLIAQALTGLVAMTGQWWLEHQEMPKREVAAHLVNLAWNGMHNLQTGFTLTAGENDLAEGSSLASESTDG